MITKQYKTIKGASSYPNFYERMICINFTSLSEAGFCEICRDTNEHYRAYHHKTGSSAVIQNKNEVKDYNDITIHGNITIIGTKEAISRTKKSLDKIAGEEFNIEEVK